MSTTKQETCRDAKPLEGSPWPHVRLAETDRLETFSDSVLSITLTLLVAEIVRPQHASRQLLERLAEQWASYIAFLASFWYAGVIWLNHQAVFARVRYCDRSLHLANLFLLLTSALIPFPTAVLSTAIQIGNQLDAKVAVALYAAIAGAMCLAWLVVFHVLSVHPYLVEDGVDPDFFPKERFPASNSEEPVVELQRRVERWRRTATKGWALDKLLLVLRSYGIGPLRATCAATSQSSHIVRSTGAPSAHLSAPSMSAISSSVLPRRRQTLSRKNRMASYPSRRVIVSASSRKQIVSVAVMTVIFQSRFPSPPMGLAAHATGIFGLGKALRVDGGQRKRVTSPLGFFGRLIAPSPGVDHGRYSHNDARAT
jgi:uncharacterized membrane protein